MALQKQTRTYAFAAGQDTGKAGAHVELPALVGLENGIFSKTGAINKRKGYERIGQLLWSGGEPTEISNLVANQRALLMLGKDATAGRRVGAAYDSQADEWVPLGGYLEDLQTCSLSVRRHATPRSDLVTTDARRAGGYDVVAYETLADSCLVDILDATTGALVASTVLTSPSYPAYESPRTVSLGSNVGVFFGDPANNDIARALWRSAFPRTAVAPGAFVTDLNASGLWDVDRLNDTTAVLAYETTTNQITIALVNVSGSVLALGTTDTEVEDPKEALGVAAFDEGGVNYACVAYIDTTTGGLSYIVWNLDTMAVHNGAVDCGVGFGGTTRNIGVVKLSSTDIELIAHEEGTSAIFDITYRRIVQRSSASFTGINLWSLNAGLASRPWLYDGKSYALLSTHSDEQSTYFLVRHDTTAFTFKMDAKLFYGRGGGRVYRNGLPGFTSVATGSYLVAVRRQARLLSDGVVTYGVGLATFSLGARVPYVDVNGSIVIGGGYLLQHDNGIEDLGFQIYPEGVANPTNVTTGGSLSDGARSYKVVYEYTDQFGRSHKSAPSPAVSVTLTGGTSTQRTTIRVPTLQFGRKASGVVVHAYRTEDTGSSYFKISEAAENTTASATVDIVDGDADSTILDNEQLYTDSGELENIAPPAASALAVIGDRIMLIPSDDPSTVWYSKSFVPGTAFSFSDSLVKPAGHLGEPLAITSLDGRAILFFGDKIAWFTGTGPNALGSGEFSELVRMNATTDIVYPLSLVEIEPGLVYQTSDGLAMLDRSLAVQRSFGDQVDEQTSQAALRSIVDIAEGQLLMVMTDGTLLAYNIESGQWATETGLAAKDVCRWNGSSVVVDANDDILKQGATFEDNGAPYPLKVKTGWLRTAGIQGFQRVYRVAILGEWRSAHTLHVDIYYDYDDATPAESHTFEVPTDPAPYQFRIKPGRQKCQSLRLDIYDSTQEGTKESMALTGIDFEVGLVGGLRRLSASASS